jgi:cysteine synthase A
MSAVLIGNTPLLPLSGLNKHFGVTVLGKAEYLNPGGSVKDRAAASLLDHYEASGQLLPGGLVCEGTGGNTGIALAMMCGWRGYKCYVSMPDTVSSEKISTMRALGATVEVCPSTVGVSDPAHYTSRARAVAASTPGAVHTDQFGSLANMRAHETGTGPEILAACPGGLDGFACAAGTGGTIAGVASFLAAASPSTQICLVDPQGSGLKSYLASGTFSKAGHEGGKGDTLTEGIGIGRLTANFAAGGPHVRAALSASDLEAFRACFLLARGGVFVGPSAALNVVGALMPALRLKRGGVDNPKVATILCDGGASYLSKIYSAEWREERGLAGVEQCGWGDVLEDEEGGYVERAGDAVFAGHEGGS